MTKYEKIEYLIKELQQEMTEYASYAIPESEHEAWTLLRALFNVRPPYPLTEEFIQIQDELLQQIAIEKGITDGEALPATRLDERIFLWQGDITTLRVDAIINAANNQMEGCWAAGHTCIDNNIHSFGGCQMRVECHRQMTELRRIHGRDYVQPTAVPMITPAYNLPSNYVIHVVGPIVRGPLNEKYRAQLAECYRASLDLAEEHHLTSIAFCCISTGVFLFPQDQAAEIATKTVRQWLDEHPDAGIQKVIFNVFLDKDFRLYDSILNKKIRIGGLF